eukprot:tig00000037_g10090.t1
MGPAGGGGDGSGGGGGRGALRRARGVPRGAAAGVEEAAWSPALREGASGPSGPTCGPPPPPPTAWPSGAPRGGRGARRGPPPRAAPPRRLERGALGGGLRGPPRPAPAAGREASLAALAAARGALEGHLAACPARRARLAPAVQRLAIALAEL